MKSKTPNPQIYCAYDELVELAGIKPNPRNPNQHPDSQIELLAKIIGGDDEQEGQGWRAPITVSTLFCRRWADMTGEIPINNHNVQFNVNEN